MSRKIKFRAWEKSSKKMRNDFWVYMRDGSVRDALGDISESVELMQFTGLRDRNGKEIYEGDVVRVNGEYVYDEYVFEVKWEHLGCDYHGGVGFGLDDADGERAPKKLEVLGNIYENPELLKV